MWEWSWVQLHQYGQKDNVIFHHRILHWSFFWGKMDIMLISRALAQDTIISQGGIQTWGAKMQNSASVILYNLIISQVLIKLHICEEKISIRTRRRSVPCSLHLTLSHTASFTALLSTCSLVFEETPVKLEDPLRMPAIRATRSWRVADQR